MTLTTHLGQLEGAGLIKVAALQPELAYGFRHGLVQEAAYFSLVKGDRQALHRAVGEALERLYRGQSARPARELLPVLAHHFAEANDPGRALEYFTLAGDAAASQYANAEAIAHYTRALEFALPRRATPAQLAHLFAQRGRAQELSGHYDEALDNYRQWESTAQQHGDRPAALAALTRRVVVFALPSSRADPTQAHALAAAAIVEAQALGDREAEARLHWAVLQAHSIQGDALAASVAGRRALDLARAIDHAELLALILMDLSRMLLAIGRADEGAAALAEATERWRALGNLPMLAECMTNTAGLHFYRGTYDQALAILAESLALSESIGNDWGQAYNLMLQFFILFDQGDYSAAIRAMRRCLPLADSGGFIYPRVTGHAVLGFVYGLLGQPEQAASLLAEGLRTVERLLPTERSSVLLPWGWLKLIEGDLETAAAYVAEAHAHLNPNDYLSPNPVLLAYLEAELALRRGQPELALQTSRRYAGEPQSSVMATFMPDLQRVEGAALLALGRQPEALTVLERAYAQAAAQPSPRAGWMLASTLAAAAQARGDLPAARRWRADARHHLDWMVDRLDDPVLRASFLAQPDVRATREAA